MKHRVKMVVKSVNAVAVMSDIQLGTLSMRDLPEYLQIEVVVEDTTAERLMAYANQTPAVMAAFNDPENYSPARNANEKAGG